MSMYSYDAFFSYATDPDRRLVRDTENFLEGLHKNRLIPATRLEKKLEICVDGSDFKRPRRTGDCSEDSDEDPVFQLICDYMALSQRLVVFVGETSRDHEWLNRELAWWLDNRGRDDVTLVLSHGADHAPEAWMPTAAREAGFARDVWLDFREFLPVSKDARSVRDFEEQRLRLAAELIGPDLVPSDLIEGWRILAERARRRSLLVRSIYALVTLGLLLATGAAGSKWIEGRRDSRAALWTTLAKNDSQDPDQLLDSLAYGVAALDLKPNADGFAATTQTVNLLAEPVGRIEIDPTGRALDVLEPIDDRWLVVAGYDAHLRVVDLDSSARVAEIEIPGRATVLDVDEDLKRIAVATQNGHFLLVGFDVVAKRLDLLGKTMVSATGEGPDRRRGQVQAMVFRPEDDLLILSGTNGGLEWYRLSEASLDDWRPYRSMVLEDPELPGLRLAIKGLAYDSQDDVLVAADIEGLVLCLSASAGFVRGSFEHVSEIFGVAHHESTRQIVMADAQGGWLTLDPTTCRPSRVVEPERTEASLAEDSEGRLQSSLPVEAARTSVAFSPDGTLVGVAGHDGTLRLYETVGATLMSLAPHRAMTRSGALRSDRSELFVATSLGDVTRWRISSKVEILRRAGIEAVSMVEERGLLVTLDEAGQVSGIDLETGGQVWRHRLEERGLSRLVPDASGTYAALFDRSRGIWWQVPLSSGSSPARRDAGIEDGVRVGDLVAAIFGGWLLGERLGEDSRVRFIGLDGKETTHWDMNGDVGTVTASRGLTAALDVSGLVAVGTAQGQRIAGLQFPPRSARLVSVGGERLFVGFRLRGEERHDRGCLCRWNAPSNAANVASIETATGCRSVGQLSCQEVGPLPDGRLHRAAWSADGGWLALSMASPDGRPHSGLLLLLSEGSNWQPSLIESRGRIDTLVFTHDGRRLVSGGRDGVGIWQLESGSLAVRLPTPSPVFDVTTNREASLVASLDGDDPGILRLWRPTADRFIETACRHWPVERPAPVRPGVPQIPSRLELCGEE